MPVTQIASRIDSRVKRAVEAVCEANGIRMNHFIEQALREKLEEMADIEDIQRIRFEPTRPLRAVLKDLKLDGRVSR